MTLQAAASSCVRMPFIRTGCPIRAPELRRRTGNNDFCRNGTVLMVRRYTARTPRIKCLPLAESWYPFREPRSGYNRGDFELRLRKPFVEEERMSERYRRWARHELGVSRVLVLIFMLVGGALGGQRGASTARQRP